MKPLLSYELKKLFFRRSVLVVLLLTLCIQAVNFVFFDYTWGYSILDANGEIQYAEGRQSVILRQNIGEQFGGILDDTLYQRIELAVSQAEQDYSGYTEDQQRSLMRKFVDQRAILSHYEDSKMQEIIVGYCDGWSKFVTNFSNIVVLCLMLLLVSGLSGLFAGEYETHMMYLLGASVSGRGKLATAKCLSAYIYVFFTYTILFLFNLLLDGCYYGLAGSECSIQSSALYAASQYPLTFGQLATLLYFGGLLGSLALAGLISVVSLAIQKTAPSMLVAILLLLAPLLFDFSDSLPNVQKWIEVTPPYFINAKEVYQETNLFWGQPLQPILSAVLSSLLLFACWGWVHHKIKKIEIAE